MTNYELVVGLECHAELMTESKMFSSCPVVDSVGAEPNSAVDALSLGMPGTLPVINRQAVEYAMRVALALNCEVQHHNIFARKNYFYPDLPKGYQISQYEEPLAVNGWLEIETESGESKRIRIRRVHMEEDTGKNTHLGDGSSLVDCNRAGVPLLEIVSEPDLSSPEEVAAFGAKLRQIVRYLGVNSGDMERGVLRLEPNISVRPVGSSEFGTRTEVKNLNSFKALLGASAFEFERQVAVIEAGGSIVQETRGWDENKRVTFSQRVKEEANDYRYFPEPDLPALFIPQTWIDDVHASLPELPASKIARYTNDMELSAYDAQVLSEDRHTAEWFEAVVKAGGQPKTTANWMINNLFSLMNEHKQGIGEIAVTPHGLVELMALVEKATISHNSAKEVLIDMFVGGKSPADIVAEKGLAQITDSAALADVVAKIMADNEDKVTAYRAGKTKLRGFFVGQVMQATRGKANPKLVNQILSEKL
jgi:aspartyl-tRNA(Asn)/glutamyl-tRNA(Gln) amidotransferase subunit B